jgi:DNA-binding NarL/FixJ family response regulator
VIKVLLTDDEPEVRQGWRMRLALEANITIVGEAYNAESALQLAAETQPNVILLDIKMPGKDGIAIIPQLRQVVPACKVIIVTLYDSPNHRRWAKEAGAAAFVAKQESPESLLTAIEQVAGQ